MEEEAITALAIPAKSRDAVVLGLPGCPLPPSLAIPPVTSIIRGSRNLIRLISAVACIRRRTAAEEHTFTITSAAGIKPEQSRLHFPLVQFADGNRFVLKVFHHSCRPRGYTGPRSTSPVKKRAGTRNACQRLIGRNRFPGFPGIRKLTGISSPESYFSHPPPSSSRAPSARADKYSISFLGPCPGRRPGASIVCGRTCSSRAVRETECSGLRMRMILARCFAAIDKYATRLHDEMATRRKNSLSERACESAANFSLSRSRAKARNRKPRALRTARPNDDNKIIRFCYILRYLSPAFKSNIIF